MTTSSPANQRVVATGASRGITARGVSSARNDSPPVAGRAGVVPIDVLIRHARQQHGLTQYQLADALAATSGNNSIGRGEVSRWERGKRVPGEYWRYWLGEVLGLASELLDASARLSRSLRAQTPAVSAQGSLTERAVAGRKLGAATAAEHHEGMKRIGVIGGGTMGVGVAYVFASRRCETVLVEPDPAQAERARDTIARRARKGEEKGKVTAATVTRNVRLLSATADLPSGLDLIVEAVPERLALKREVLGEAEAKEPGMLATNTSGLSIDELAHGLRRPANFLGLHFFNPVWAMPLLEIVRGTATADETVANARAVAELIGKEPIVVRDSPGFASSRLGVALGLEAIRMLEDGVASAADIDRAMELGYRHPMGPLRLTDLVGLDVRLDIARHLAAAYGPRFEPPTLLIDKVAAGELGKKTGRGFYDWT